MLIVALFICNVKFWLMCKVCSECALAQAVVIKSVREVGTVVANGQNVLNDSTTRETSVRVVIRRGCSQGGTETVEGFDKCISKLEFLPRS